MDAAALDDPRFPREDVVQCTHAIYVWTKLLQPSALDETERARAAAIIERNRQLLLTRLGS